MLAADLPDGTPVKLTKSVPTPSVVFARGSVGLYYGPPNSKGYVMVKISGMYAPVLMTDLIHPGDPLPDAPGPEDPRDTPESGGFKILWKP